MSGEPFVRFAAFLLSVYKFKSMTKSNVLFVELQTSLTDGRAFDALIPGKRKDMMGRAVEFKQSELAEYLANTQAAITAATSEGGEIVGLPIDRLNPRGSKMDAHRTRVNKRRHSAVF